MLFITFDSENVTDHICVSVLKQYNLELQTAINSGAVPSPVAPRTILQTVPEPQMEHV